MPDSTPTADDVRKLMRTNNIKLVMLAVCTILAFTTVVFSAASRTASRDSQRAVEVQLADNERSACITERRNVQLDQIGRVVTAGLRAQKAALIDLDMPTALRLVDEFDRAASALEMASASLSPDVLDDPSPNGCGPPVVSDDQVRG